MKGFGIFCIVIAILNFFVAIVAAADGAPEDIVSSKFGGVIMFSVLGAFLLSRANKKKRDEENKKKWDNE